MTRRVALRSGVRMVLMTHLHSIAQLNALPGTRNAGGG
jgi:hypothetical protein